MKLEDVTPLSLKCINGACPAIYESAFDSYIIIGKKRTVTSDSLPPNLSIGSDQAVIEVPVELLLERVKAS